MKQYKIVIPEEIKNKFFNKTKVAFDPVPGILITHEMLIFEGIILKEDDFKESFCGLYFEYKRYYWPKRYFIEMTDIQNINITRYGITPEELQKCKYYKSKNMCNHYCEMYQDNKCQGGKE